ncbi:DUF935 family protein [Granulicella sp. WH15]|uniref:phage portal protein family protein n=1 Tax=Granulicella sp. WH15 TaxID=2602070 RepID=UPI0013676D09|nr:DUF935 family protein [Granulicella sp. WH15]QHN04417.1 DUF935 family protein [Granulicella sp. WH15]
MADQTIPPLPPQGQLVTQQILQQAIMAGWLNTNAFSGLRDPTHIWQQMTYGGSQAIPLYRELEDKDDDVSSALDELKLSVLEREWTIEPGDDSQAALDARDFAKAQLDGVDFDAAMDTLLDAAPYGFSCAELMFDTSMGQASLLSIDDCPQEMFLFGERFQPQTGPIQLLDYVGSSTGTIVPAEKFAVFSYRGRSRNRMGRPLLKNAFWPSWFKRQILGLWLKAGGKANGTAVARYAEGASAQEMQFAVECAEGLVDGVAMAIPQNMDYDVDLLKVARGSDPGIYEKLFTQMQYAIARAIKGETLTSFGNEGGKGSNAQGNTHADTFEKRSISLAKKENAVINNQILRPVHLWNFGPNVPPPRFSWDIAEDKDLTGKLAIMTGAQRIGVPIPAKWAAQVLEIPPVGEDDQALIPNVSGAVPALPGAAFAESSEDVKEADFGIARLDKLSAQMKRESMIEFRTRTRQVAERLSRGGN